MASSFKDFYYRHERALPVLYFIIGFAWDSLTLDRIDHFYSTFVLSSYIIWLMVFLYIFNLADDGYWENTFLEKYEQYVPLAIQFFFGSSISAYIVFFFRSVSLTKTMAFLILLVFMYIANEMFKHRISNKYLQFGAFFFVTFTYFEFTIPVFVGTMSTFLFLISGVVALGATLFFVTFIYRKSPSTRREISLTKLTVIIICLYSVINIFYYFNLIPPVPMALKSGVIAYNVKKNDNAYTVTYDPDKSYKIWRSFNHEVAYMPGDTVFAYASIFAPTDLNTSVAHRWKWYNPKTKKWEVSDDIGYKVYGGRDGGYRGYTFKTNLQPGKWEVDVITKAGLILGTMDFTLVKDPTFSKSQLVQKKFE